MSDNQLSSRSHSIYNADHAQLDYEKKCSACRGTSELAYQIECELEGKWSPEQIANTRKKGPFKTIYTWLYDGVLDCV